MDIVLVCSINNLCKSLNPILLTSIVANIANIHDVEIRIDYKRSKLFINIMGDKGNSIYIKKCHLDDVIQEIKKIESI
jgi:hypothetical protein